MKIAIVENEQYHIDRVKKFVKDYSDEKGIYIETVCFYDGLSFLDEYTADFDAVFIDILMPMMDGIEVCERLREKDEDVQIVFVTNMADYAIKGYKVNALDFLVKPVDYYDIALELDKLVRLQRNKELEHLWITAEGGEHKLSFYDISFIEITNHDISVHTGKRTYTFRGTLKDVEKRLNPRLFSRSDNCYIVNLNYISSIKDNEIYLTTGENLHISRARKKSFMADLAQYINRS